MSDNNTKTILFADDDWFIEPFVAELRDAGYRVLQSTAGRTTLDILDNNEVDLLILDIMMPPGEGINDSAEGKRTGIRVAEIIRKDLKLDLPIIYMTVISDVKVLEILENIEREANQEPRIYVKPVDLEDFLAEIETCLRVIKSE